MKKLLYPIIGFVIFCFSFVNIDKKKEDKRIEEQGSDNLILRPFQIFGLLWSCSPDHSEEISSQDPTHYSELVDSVTNSGTHSSFMIDKKNKERHYIVKKNKKAITEIIRIKESDNIIDDEVLNEAFGINVYRDLLNPHSVLVEGASDKIILQKAFECLDYKGIGITNGHGSNIDTLASKMNFDNISVLVVTDDDKDGRNYKENILKIGGAYNEDTVFTIRDLVGEIIEKGTIEDTLDIKYVEAQFKKNYNSTYGKVLTGTTLTTSKPVIMQITAILKEKKEYSGWNMDSFKKQLSEEFNPTKTSLSTKFKLLKALAEKIKEQLSRK